MRRWTALAAISMLTIGLSGCGKYGPPERTVVPREKEPAPWEIQAQPPVTEERIQEPADFDDAQADEVKDQ
jgi:hypothetical protein